MDSRKTLRKIEGQKTSLKPSVKHQEGNFQRKYFKNPVVTETGKFPCRLYKALRGKTA